MPAPINTFKQALNGRRAQIGLWLGLADPYSAGLLANTGFDWLVLDGEHSPSDLRTMLGQLQAIGTSGATPVIRLPSDETWMIKQALDIGCQTVLVPMVESEEQAIRLARAMRYAPEGTRGVGAALARASGFNAIPDYLMTANDEVCLLVQIESRAGLSALEAVSSVPGVDGIFIGPADLAADMGLRGQPGHPEVQDAVTKALACIHAAGKPSGILTSDVALAKRYLDQGVTFVAVGSDIGILRQAALSLRSTFP